ncbi:hypothetical protein ESD82_19050 [Paracoccus pantotrophus]|nr:hypothetical protein [Paracoccus pantotrophus]QFG38148.1 hypothetical protein ESD82_19050 [Paracoccus pantotrophus]
MRDFLHSEISQFEGIPNLPSDPELAIRAGKHLCEDLLEPLQDTFGRIAIRSAYRSATINDLGHRKGYGCASNWRNFARHIWDVRDENGAFGATACIVIPWFADRYAAGEDWRALAWWIHDHLPYSEMCFYPRLCAFNIAWHELPNGAFGATACIVIPWFADRYAAGEDWRALAWWIHDHLPYSEMCFYPRLCAFNIAWHELPKRIIRSYIDPKGVLKTFDTPSSTASHADWYRHWGERYLQPVAPR